jgi:hypothetical protein
MKVDHSKVVMEESEQFFWVKSRDRMETEKMNENTS